MANKPIRCVAHRGASLYATDNTLSAYRLAAEQGADLIELDIRVSLDGRIVVYHDATISIPGGCEERIERIKLDRLLSISLAGGEHIPRFEDVIALCKSLNLGIYVEFKDTNEAITRQVIGLLRDGGLLDNSILFGSRPDHVFMVKQIEPAARTCISYRNAGIDPLLLALVCQADGLNLAWEDYPQPHTLITPDWLARVRAAGLRIMSWHEERADELAALVALGIDDLCTNDPALAHRLIGEAAG